MAKARDVLTEVVALLNATQGWDAPRLARTKIAEAGITPNVHVGLVPEGFTHEVTCEWLLGQIADIIDSCSWFAMNSILGRCQIVLAEVTS